MTGNYTLSPSDKHTEYQTQCGFEKLLHKQAALVKLHQRVYSFEHSLLCKVSHVTLIENKRGK